MPSVVVGVDGSQASILALRWAGVIAPLMSAEIRAVTACIRISRRPQMCEGSFTISMSGFLLFISMARCHMGALRYSVLP
jgi:hypothetical protein